MSVILQLLGSNSRINHKQGMTLRPNQWHFDARALELTRAIALEGRCLRSQCDREPELGYRLMERFSLIMLETLQSNQLQML